MLANILSLLILVVDSVTQDDNYYYVHVRGEKVLSALGAMNRACQCTASAWATPCRESGTAAAVP